MQIFHVDLKRAAWFSAVPWSVMAFMGYVGGMCSDKLIRSGTSITLTRKIMQVVFPLFFHTIPSVSILNIHNTILVHFLQYVLPGNNIFLISL